MVSDSFLISILFILLSINLLTLFALVLAIGIVVDDAIVVMEAVHAKLDEGYTSSHDASVDAMSELSSTIVAITLVMAAVFIPVSFIGGSTGVFLGSLVLTLPSDIMISAINAITLSPALILYRFNTDFDNIKNKYKKSIRFLNRRRWIIPGMVAVFIALLGFFLKTTPSGFVPKEDQGTISATSVCHRHFVGKDNTK